MTRAEALYKLKKRIKDCSGITLIELLIVLGLLSIILVMGFTLFFFGINSFQYGESRADVQQNARIVTEFVSDATRIAERVIIISEYDGVIQELDVSAFPDLEIEQPGDGFYVYLIFQNEGMVYFQEVDGSYQPAIMLEEISENIDFNLRFEKGIRNNLLKFTLDADDITSGRNYNLETEILILNLSDIEDTTGGAGGTAIIYQVPAPYPAIRRISLTPDVLDAVSSGGQEIAARITTIEVADGKTISATFHKVSTDGSDEPVTSISIFPLAPVITSNVSEFRIDLPTGSPLNFGDYFASFQVEGVDFPLRRFFYLLPVIESITVTPLPGKVREGTVEIITKGVPAGTAAEITTVIDPPEGNQLFVALVEKTGVPENPFIFYNFEIKDAGTVDVNGRIEFKVFNIDVEEGADKDLFVTAKIGRLDWWIGEIFLNANAYLYALSVDPGVLNTVFAYDQLTYDVTVGADVEAITVTATLDDENATMTIKGDPAESGVGNIVTLGDSGTATIINIIVTAEDGETTNTYAITVNRE